MGTKSGKIVVLDAATLKVTFSGVLERPSQEDKQSISNIIQIYFGETSLILVTYNGKLWSLYDKTSRNRFEIHDEQLFPCGYSHLVKVKNGRSFDVWGTTEKNHIFFLEKELSGWRIGEVIVESLRNEYNLDRSSCIVNNQFTGTCGSEMSHIWIAYHQRSVLVSFDAITREQRCMLDCAQYISKSRIWNVHYVLPCLKAQESLSNLSTT